MFLSFPTWELFALGWNEQPWSKYQGIYANFSLQKLHQSSPEKPTFPISRRSFNSKLCFWDGVGWKKGRERGTIIFGKDFICFKEQENPQFLLPLPCFCGPSCQHQEICCVLQQAQLLHPPAQASHHTSHTLLNKNIFIGYKFDFIMKIENIIFFFQKGIYPLIYKKPLTKIQNIPDFLQRVGILPSLQKKEKILET